MDKYTKCLMTVIAVGVTLIAARLYFPPSASTPPTYGDFLDIRHTQDPAARKQSFQMLLNRLPLVRVQGGDIDANVSGNVQIDR